MIFLKSQQKLGLNTFFCIMFTENMILISPEAFEIILKIFENFHFCRPREKFSKTFGSAFSDTSVLFPESATVSKCNTSLLYREKLFPAKVNSGNPLKKMITWPQRIHFLATRAGQLSLIANLGLRRATVNLVAPERPHEGDIASPYTFNWFRKILFFSEILIFFHFL